MSLEVGAWKEKPLQSCGAVRSPKPEVGGGGWGEFAALDLQHEMAKPSTGVAPRDRGSTCEHSTLLVPTCRGALRAVLAATGTVVHGSPLRK